MKLRTIDVDEDVANVLTRSPIRDGVLTLPDQLDRQHYQRTAKVLGALGLKWDRRIGGFAITPDLATDLADALTAGKVVDRKRTLELFETPVAIANQMAQLAMSKLPVARLDIGAMRFLEPSAGRGRLVSAMGSRFIGGDELLAIDIDAANCQALKDQGIATEVICGDFIGLGCQIGKQADVILMNPPFANTADILHVTHAYTRWLAPGGVLVAIMSPHWTFAEDTPSRSFRQLMRDVTLSGNTMLPEGAFKAEGTGVRTVMVWMQKAVA